MTCNMEDVIHVKTANTRYEVLDVIKKRWSPRSFDGKSLSESQMATLIEAASWAPSAMNEQPWRFMVGLRSDKATFRQLSDFLMPGNAVWAANAGALVLVLGKTHYEYKGKPNGSVVHDCGLATMNLLLQAADMDIYAHVMGGFDKARVTEEFGLGEEYVPVTMIALGFLDNPEKLDEPYRSRELAARERKPVEELLYRPDVTE